VIWILMAAALAAPPEGVDPTDFERWEVAADAALDGPEGCWELTGTLRVDAALHSPATAFTRGDTAKLVASGTWSGRLDTGTWTRFDYTLTSAQTDDPDLMEVPIFPVIGKIDQDVVNVEHKAAHADDDDDDELKVEKSNKRRGSVSISIGGDDDDDDGPSGGAEAINLMQQAIDAWDPSTATSVTQWLDEPGAIELLQDFPIFDDDPKSPVVTVTSHFPEGGTGLSRLDAQFPKRVKVGEWPLRVNLMDVQFHLRQQQIGRSYLPQVEGFTLMAGVLGFTFGYEQQIAYATAQACVSE